MKQPHKSVTQNKDKEATSIFNLVTNGWIKNALHPPWPRVNVLTADEIMSYRVNFTQIH